MPSPAAGDPDASRRLAERWHDLRIAARPSVSERSTRRRRRGSGPSRSWMRRSPGTTTHRRARRAHPHAHRQCCAPRTAAPPSSSNMSAWVISDGNQPGAMALTRTPCDPFARRAGGSGSPPPPWAAVARVLHGRGRHEPEDRGDVHDASAPAASIASGELTQVERRDEVDVHGRAEVFERLPLGGHRRAVTGVVDQHGHGTGRLHGAGHEAFSVLGHRQVSGHPITRSPRSSTSCARRSSRRAATTTVAPAACRTRPRPVAQTRRGTGHDGRGTVQTEQAGRSGSVVTVDMFGTVTGRSDRWTCCGRPELLDDDDLRADLGPVPQRRGVAVALAHAAV